MTAPRKHTLELYTDRVGQFRWRRRASNGRIVSDSGESYVDRRDAIHGMHIANPDFRELRLIDDADNLPSTVVRLESGDFTISGGPGGDHGVSLTDADIDDEETSDE